MICPRCGGRAYRAVYYGLPVNLCANELYEESEPECGLMWGFWVDVLLQYLPFNGWFMVYEGNYWLALWRWFARPWVDGEGDI